ncbi:hypothetical protein [Ascidiaceihabitans sp.]|uniref:hypothetical protein n=1 Tax=Ascidiaceihabitans sp. TaxID=1872644 RepID=UPI0032987BF7
MQKRLKRFRSKNQTEKIVWDAVKDLDSFCHADIAKVTGMPSDGLRVVISKMFRQGLFRIHHSVGNVVHYTSFSIAWLLQDNLEKRMSDHGAVWAAIRLTKEFVVTDLLAGIVVSRPEITESFISDYCELLRNAGHLVFARKAMPESGRMPVYRLVKNTGPIPPEPKHTTVLVDHNLNKVVHVEGVFL